MKGALDDITVVDFGWVLAGPYCSMVLRDLGANVIKIERPGRGDLVRGTPPLWTEKDSGYFMSINRGKKSVTLDVSKEAGRNILFELVKKADVMLENFIPGNVKRLGIDYETVRKVNPRIVYASISGFGQTGPYANLPALDVIVQGVGGIMSVTGEPDSGPVRVGASIGDIMAGVFTALGILAALHERESSGEGQYIDTSMMDVQAAVLENPITRYLVNGKVPARHGSRHPSFTPFQAFETRDGYLVVACISTQPDPFTLLCNVMGLPELIEDPRFSTPYSRSDNYGTLEPILSERFKTRTTDEWVRDIREVGVPCGPVNTIDRIVKDPQIEHRNMLVEFPHPRVGTWRGVNSPLKLSRTPGQARGVAPDLGEHTEEVLTGTLGMSKEQVEELRKDGVV